MFYVSLFFAVFFCEHFYVAGEGLRCIISSLAPKYLNHKNVRCESGALNLLSLGFVWPMGNVFHDLGNVKVAKHLARDLLAVTAAPQQQQQQQQELHPAALSRQTRN